MVTGSFQNVVGALEQKLLPLWQRASLHQKADAMTIGDVVLFQTSFLVQYSSACCPSVLVVRQE